MLLIGIKLRQRKDTHYFNLYTVDINNNDIERSQQRESANSIMHLPRECLRSFGFRGYCDLFDVMILCFRSHQSEWTHP